jgi:hypothetical protein
MGTFWKWWCGAWAVAFLAAILIPSEPGVQAYLAILVIAIFATLTVCLLILEKDSRSPGVRPWTTIETELLREQNRLIKTADDGPYESNGRWWFRDSRGELNWYDRDTGTWRLA